MGRRIKKKAARKQIARWRAEKPTVFCIGAGPSLTQEDCERIRGYGRVIAVNNAFQLVPWADVLYACDANWWNKHFAAVTAIASGELWIQNNVNGRPDKLHYDCAQKYGLNVIPGREGVGLGRDVIHYGNNSGYQAINLAYLWGAARIVLLGYDMQHTGGKVHFFGDHPKGLGNFPKPHDLLPKFDELAADLATEGVEVINCTRQTALQCFRQLALEDCLALLSAPAQASTSAA